MEALTLDLIATVLASVAALAAGGLAVWVLPWSEEDWKPRPLPAKAVPPPPPRSEPAARVAHATLVP
jgi:hypothetical protein